MNLDLAHHLPAGERLLEPAMCLGEPSTAEGDEPDDVERAVDAALAAAVDELVAGALVGGVPPAGAPVEKRGRERQHLAAVRLFDGVGVLPAFGDGDLCGPRVHDPGRHERDVPVAGHADALEARVSRLAGSPHPVLEPGLVPAVDDVDPGEEDVALQHHLAIADPLRERPGRDRLVARCYAMRMQTAAHWHGRCGGTPWSGRVPVMAGLPPPRRSPGSSTRRTHRSAGRSRMASTDDQRQHLGRVDRPSGFQIELARTYSRPGAFHVALDCCARLREPGVEVGLLGDRQVVRHVRDGTLVELDTPPGGRRSGSPPGRRSMPLDTPAP